MDIRSVLKEREKKSYRKMSRGMRIRLAIELSEFAQKFAEGLLKHGKRIQGNRKSPQRSKAS